LTAHFSSSTLLVSPSNFAEKQDECELQPHLEARRLRGITALITADAANGYAARLNGRAACRSNLNSAQRNRRIVRAIEIRAIIRSIGVKKDSNVDDRGVAAIRKPLVDGSERTAKRGRGELEYIYIQLLNMVIIVE